MTASKQSQDGTAIPSWLLGSGHHSAMVSSIQFSNDRFQAESGWTAISSWLLGSGHHSALESLMQVFDDRFQAKSGWNCNFILTAWKRSSFGTGKSHAGVWWPLPSKVRMELQIHPYCLEAVIIRHWKVSCRFLMTASKQSQDGTAISSWLLGSGHHSALVSFMQVSDDRFQAKSGWNCNFILTAWKRSSFGTGKFHAGFWWPLPSKVRMELQFHPDCLEAVIIRHWKVSCRFLMTASKQSQDRTAISSWLCLKAVIRNLHETYQCQMYSRKLLMIGK